jgi:hypothetical protein
MHRRTPNSPALPTPTWRISPVKLGADQVGRDAAREFDKPDRGIRKDPISPLSFVDSGLQSQFSETMARLSARKPEAGL